MLYSTILYDIDTNIKLWHCHMTMNTVNIVLMSTNQNVGILYIGNND